MEDIVIIGTSGFGREVAWLIEEINKDEKIYNIIGFIDDNIDLLGSEINGYEVLGNTEWLLDKNLNVAFGIADPNTKYKLFSKLEHSQNKFPNLIHPSVIQSNIIKYGFGNVICAGTILTVNIEIGNFVTINLDCTVGHDTTLNDYVTILPSVNVSGNVEIHEKTMIGTGSAIIQGINIGSNSIVGAGAVVTKTMPKNSVIVGVPAKVIKARPANN